MTIKANRADALRKMTYDEADSYMMGGMVDESVPTSAIREALAGENVDIETFEAYLGRRLGLYRDLSTPTPSVAKELCLIDEAIKAADQALLRLANLPPTADAYANQVCWRYRGELYSDRSRGLSDQLTLARTVLTLSARELDEHSGKSGTKTKLMRDTLLRDIAHWLQDAGITQVVKAADKAATILNAAGIKAPGDPKESRRIVLSMEGKIRR